MPDARAHWLRRLAAHWRPHSLEAARMSQPEALYPVPAAFAATARIDRDEYQRLYAESVRDPDAFWGQVATRLDWMQAPTQVKDVSFDIEDFRIRWYGDGVLNASVNCLDRHLAA